MGITANCGGWGKATLLGRNWLQHVKLTWKEIFKVQTVEELDQDQLKEILAKYEAVFDGKLGQVKGTYATLYVDLEAKLRYFKPRSVPYTLKKKIEDELGRLEKEGTISPVDFSEWVTPIVPILKSDPSVCISGDYKVTINPVTKLDNYPIPKTEDLYATLGGGESYTKLDLSQAYQQLLLDEKSRNFTTINTHKGLFRYNRLCYGLKSALGIFQRAMKSILQGIGNVIIRINDILLTGTTRRKHLETLEEVLNRLEKFGIRLNREKCKFLVPEVLYLGHLVNREGIKPSEEKVKSINKVPRPTSVKELQAFWGMINYYAQYIPNISNILAPSHQLLKKEAKWEWTSKQEQAWEEAKEQLNSPKVLVHFDPSKAVTVACDASPYGVGTVLSHIMEDGSERPIAFISRTLAPAEKNYSQIDKEALAVVFGVKRFR